jgi:hypothetical protein
MRKVKIDELAPRAPGGFWKDLAKKLIDLPDGMGLAITNDDFPHNGFTNYRQSLYNQLVKEDRSLRSRLTGKHEVLLWTVKR